MRKALLLARLLRSGAYHDADPDAMRWLVQDVIINPLIVTFYAWATIGGIMAIVEVWRMMT